MRYIVNQINPLGDYDEKYGQRYWGHVHDSDYEVSFNLMNPVNIEPGDTLDFEEKVIKESKKGKEYLFLRKVKVNAKDTPTATQSPSKGTRSTMEYEPSTNARWAIGMAYRAFVQVTGTPEDNGGEFPFDAVYKHASELVKMFDKIKNSGSPDSSPPVSSKEAEQPAAEPTIQQKLAKGFNKQPTELGEEDIPQGLFDDQE